MLLGAVTYLVFVLGSFDTNLAEPLVELTAPTLIGWNVLLLIVTALVIVDSVRKVRQGKTMQLATGVFVVKLTAIPFFLINFALMAMIAAAGLVFMVHGIGLALWMVVAISVVLTYFAMVSTSVYGWASVLRLRRDGRINSGLAVLYSLLLLVFVADIVAGILLFVHARRGRTALAAGEVPVGEFAAL
jgi:hypothetical protein